MIASNISQDSNNLSFIRFSAMMTAAMGAGAYVVGLIVTKTFPTSPLFPLVFAVSQATSTALNAATLIITGNYEKKNQITKYQIAQLQAAGYAVVGTATTVSCLALGIFGPPLALAIAGEATSVFWSLLEAREEYKKLSRH